MAADSTCQPSLCAVATVAAAGPYTTDHTLRAHWYLVKVFFITLSAIASGAHLSHTAAGIGGIKSLQVRAELSVFLLCLSIST